MLLPETTTDLHTETTFSFGVTSLGHYLEAYQLIHIEENTVTQLTKGYQRIREELADVASACKTQWSANASQGAQQPEQYGRS